MLSEESGYRSATDAEFAELIWGGLSQAGAEVSPQQGYKKSVTSTSPNSHCTFPQELWFQLLPLHCQNQSCTLTLVCVHIG